MKLLSHDRYADFQMNAPADEAISCADHPPPREQTERAVLKTLLYSDLFEYPLTPAEISHYLIGIPGAQEEVEALLSAPGWLRDRISFTKGFVTLRGREHLVAGRSARSQASVRLWRKARRFIRLLSILPFVRMVAVTGALAMDNSSDGDDVDLLMVTAPSRVWLARALAVLVVYVGKLTPNTLCPNYVISQEALRLEPQTVFVAHEFVQMVPVYGREVYERMRSANPWVRQMLPNAGRPVHFEPEFRPGGMALGFKRILERLLGGAVGDRLEAWEMRRKLHKFAPRMSGAGDSVILDKNQVKGHFDDHGARICTQFRQRLEEQQLLTEERV